MAVGMVLVARLGLHWISGSDVAKGCADPTRCSGPPGTHRMPAL